MNLLPVSLLFAVMGVLYVVPMKYIFAKMPEAWLQDYGYDPASKDFRPAARMRVWPHMILAVLFSSAAFFFTAYTNPSYVEGGMYLHYMLVFLPIFPLILVVMSDMLNRIIPDQLSLVIGAFALLGFAADAMEGSIWFPSGSPWYYAVLNRILGGLIGALLLWGIGFIGSILAGRESLGFGDVKLILACGLLSGAYGLIFVIFIAFVTGGIFAVPLLIRKRKRIRREEHMILVSEDPDATRAMLEKQKDDLHYADDPDYIAFGPFLAIGTVVFMVLETSLFQVFSMFFPMGVV